VFSTTAAFSPTIGTTMPSEPSIEELQSQLNDVRETLKDLPGGDGEEESSSVSSSAPLGEQASLSRAEDSSRPLRRSSISPRSTKSSSPLRASNAPRTSGSSGSRPSQMPSTGSTISTRDALALKKERNALERALHAARADLSRKDNELAAWHEPPTRRGPKP
jgi:hypothetical protein